MQRLQKKKEIVEMKRDEWKLKKDIFSLYIPFHFNIKFSKIIVLFCIVAIVAYTFAAIYIQKYKDIMQKNIYGDKYIFGSVAVKTDKGFITTIRGKENLNGYTIVSNVNHINHTLNAINLKATLNAPLLDYLFKNEKVKVIVHINHEYDDQLPYYDYAFPGTVKDSIRDNKTSFNIKHHGVIYLFDKNGNLI